MPRLLLALVTLLTSCFISAHAQDIEALERQLEQARVAAPMAVKPFMTVKRPAKYFGDYEPRSNNEFRRGEKVLFYGEPKNLTFASKAGGVMEIGFDVDVEIKGPDGKTMGQEKVMSMKLPTRSRVQDIYLNLDLELDKAPPGKYGVKFTVRDQNSKKSAIAAGDVTIK
ncbi:MAG: hypothetical protein ABIQ84_05095 [Usitatibacter sp.]